MRAVLAVVACAAVVATAGAVNHVRAANAGCSAAAATHRSNQDPAEVAAFWTTDQIAQAQQNMRRTSDTEPSAKGSC